jgi:hypothetical protein
MTRRWKYARDRVSYKGRLLKKKTPEGSKVLGNENLGIGNKMKDNEKGDK